VTIGIDTRKAYAMWNFTTKHHHLDTTYDVMINGTRTCGGVHLVVLKDIATFISDHSTVRYDRVSAKLA